MAGRLMTLIDPRILLFVGLSCCVVSLNFSIDFTPDTATRTIVWVSMLQGFGLGFMFVPLNMIALSTVPVALRTQGTAMWTLIRNLGSSIGVSIVIANLTNKTIMMHARLAESVTPFNQAMADPAAAMLDPDDRYGARAAGEPHHPAGDHHRLRQRLQADDVDDPAGLSAGPADPHQPAPVRGVAVRPVSPRLPLATGAQTPRRECSRILAAAPAARGLTPLNTPACGRRCSAAARPGAGPRSGAARSARWRRARFRRRCAA